MPGVDSDFFQNLITCSFFHFRDSLKTFSKSLHNILCYVADRQTTDRKTPLKTPVNKNGPDKKNSIMDWIRDKINQMNQVLKQRLCWKNSIKKKIMTNYQT